MARAKADLGQGTSSPPGQRLVESELAEKYKTSRGAVREALALLQNERLVTRQRNRSAWVRAVTIEEAIEILEVRALIEGLCAARAAIRAAEEDRRELRRLADEMTAAVKNGDVLTDSRLSDQIHTRLRELAGQQTAAGTAAGQALRPGVTSAATCPPSPRTTPRPGCSSRAGC